jgi:rhodanese-related sulfurtransferase
METPSRINPAQTKDLLEKNQVIKIIDVRTKSEYDQQHFPGAEHISMEDIVANGIPYSIETPVLITCNLGLKKSDVSAQSLNERGYSSVYILDGGIKAWFS